MLGRLVEFSLTQRVLVLVAAAGLALAGALAFLELPVDAYPDIAPTQVKLILKAPGMTPEEVESRVVAPLELELLGLPNGTMLRSTAKYAIADITLDFAEGTDIYWARQQVAERFGNVALPDGVGGGLAPIATPLSDLFMFTIEGGDLPLAERRALLDWVIRPALRTIPGVADVNALGGEVSSYVVVPDRAAPPACISATWPTRWSATTATTAPAASATARKRWWSAPRARCAGWRTCATSCCGCRTASPCGSATWPRCAWPE